MKLILILIGLSACAAHHPEDSRAAVATPPPLVVAPALSEDGLVLIGRPGGTYYYVPASVANSAETREWYERGQEAIARRKAQTETNPVSTFDPLHRTDGANSDRVRAQWVIDHNKEVAAQNGGTLAYPTATSPSVPVVPCPKDRDPVTLAETVACQNAELAGVRAEIRDLKKTDDAIIDAVGVDHPK